MGFASDHALGYRRKFFISPEATAGTFEKPVATDAAKILKFDVDYKQERRDRMDSRASRSVLERITGRKTIPWSLEAYLVPSGSLGTAPDLGEVFKACLGSETVNASTSVVYSLSAVQSFPTLSLIHFYNDLVMETIWGAWVESMTISGSGGDDPRVSFEGAARGYRLTSTTTLDGAMSGSTSMTVDDDAAVGIGSVVQVGTDDNSSAGFAVTAGVASPFTLEAVATAGDGDAMIPFVPSETTAGSPISGIAGELDIDAVTSLKITNYEVRMSNGFKPIDDEALQEAPTDAIVGLREVSGSLTMRARKDHILELAKRPDFGSRDIKLTLGDTAGKKVQIDIDQAEFEFSKLEVPETEEGTFTLPFKGLGSSGEDELIVTFI